MLALGRDASGRKRQKWVGGFRTKKDAEVALAKALDRVHTGTFVDVGPMTVGEYLEQWLDGIRASVREKTAFSYEDTLRAYVIARVGSVRLADLGAPRIAALYAELLKPAPARRPLGADRRLHTKIVQELLSHANVSVTLDTYSHVAPVLHEQAALTIGDMVFDVPRGRTPKRRAKQPLTRSPASAQLRLDESL